MDDIDDKVLDFSKHNLDLSKAPKKGESIFAHLVTPTKIKSDVIRLEDSLSKYEKICDNRNTFSMGLSERSQKHRELRLRSLKRKYKIS